MRVLWLRYAGMQNSCEYAELAVEDSRHVMTPPAWTWRGAKNSSLYKRRTNCEMSDETRNLQNFVEKIKTENG